MDRQDEQDMARRLREDLRFAIQTGNTISAYKFAEELYLLCRALERKRPESCKSCPSCQNS